MPHCGPCNRYFVNSNALQNHLRYSNEHIYCFRCSRDFASVAARKQHYANSSSHWQCPMSYCDIDFCSQKDLRVHRISAHNWCDRCHDYFSDHESLRDHRIEYHNICHICDQIFDSPANLTAHLGWHRPRDIECYGCEQRFKSRSAMVLHLEYSGQCDSQSDLDIVERIARQCYAYKKYRNNDDNSDCFPFECPCCGVVFKHMSGLLQHAESERCEVKMGPGTPLGRFLRYLWHRVG